MRNLLIIIMISILAGVCACSEDHAELIIESPEPTIAELEALVVENCHTLQAALEEFASSNDGACPLDVYSETNDLGLTVIDYLPGGELMVNPFTGERTEPVDTIAAEPGQTGYSTQYSFRSLYNISGFGESGVVAELSNAEELEQRAIENCFIVREAVMRFALLNDGEFPTNLDIDTTPEGYTVVDLLPEGMFLENPMTRVFTEPVDGVAVMPGETGYVPIVVGGSNVGFAITGTGVVASVTIFRAGSDPGCTYISIYSERIYCSGNCCF